MSPTNKFHEYAFDVKMYAVVRIRATSRKAAESVLEQALDGASLKVKARHSSGRIVEASTHVDDVEFPYLFEFDRQDVEAEELDVE